MGRANRGMHHSHARSLYANKSVHKFVAALGKGIAVKCVTVSMMIWGGRQAEENDDKTYQLIGGAYTTSTRVHLSG